MPAPEPSANATATHTLPFPAPGANDAVFLLDLSAYVFRAYHALPPLSSSQGEPTHAVRGTYSMLEKLRKEHKPAHLIAIADSPGPNFRHALYPDYKANRDAPPPDLKEQLNRVYQLSRAMGLPLAEVSGFEADDLIATLTRQARNAGMRVVIVSSDKDLMQLVASGVWLLDTMKGRIIDSDAVHAKFGVTPEKLGDYLALCGDAVDNIPGVAGIGPKTASALLNTSGTLEQLLSAPDRVERKAWREKLRASSDEARLSRKLVTLCEDAPLALAPLLEAPAVNTQHLTELLEILEFRRASAQARLALDSAEGEAPVSRAGGAPAGDALSADGATHGGAQRQCLVPLDSSKLLAWLNAGTSCVVSCGSTCMVTPDGIALMPITSAALSEVLRLAPEASDALPIAVLSAKRVVRSDAVIASVLRQSQRLDFDLSLGAHLLGLSQSRGLDIAALERRFGPPPSLITPLSASEWEAGGYSAESWDGVIFQELARLFPLLNRIKQALKTDERWDLLREIELPLAWVLGAMEATGVLVDVDWLADLSDRYGKLLKASETKAHTLAGHPFNLASPKQLETVLFDELGLPVVKRTKTGRSTNSEVLTELSHAHPICAELLRFRSLAKLKNTYLDTLPLLLGPDGRIHTTYHQDATATGRLSSSAPNLQNIPIKTEEGRAIRKAFRAPPAWCLIAADYSQIELRMLAHLSLDEALCEAFATDVDIHRLTAAALFGTPEETVSRSQRAIGKTINFAVLYGQSDFSLAKVLDVPRAEAAAYIAAFFTRYAGVRRYFDGLLETARQTGYVTTPRGRRRELPDLSSRNAHLRQAAERMAQNLPVQGGAAEILKVAMIKVQAALTRESLSAKLVLTVHDELVLECPEAEADHCGELLRDTMVHALPLHVPLVVDMGRGLTWHTAH